MCLDENGELAVPVNNTLVRHTAFLAADTRPCVLIQGVENGKLAVPVNNTLVHHTAFLAADTRPCVLMYIGMYTAMYVSILS